MTELITALLISMGISLSDVTMEHPGNGATVIRTPGKIIIVKPSNSQGQPIIVIDDIGAGKVE